MKRGLASPWIHSALATTRRLRLQLSSVLHWKSLKRHAGWPLPSEAAFAAASSFLDHGCQPLVARQPEHKIHAVFFAPRHQALARKAAIGPQQDAHIGPAGADRAADPRPLASMLERRSLAASRCRPQNT